MPTTDAYRLAERDIDFLNGDVTRGVRLQLEYLKAETLLREHGVRHTMLVLGSTRAKRTGPWYGVAREFGRIAGQARNVAVMTGGGPGIMEAANRGAREAGAPSIGLNIDLPRRQRPNRYITPGLCLRFRYFALRKMHFMLRARALVVFPGGFGTLDELFETLTLVQSGKIRPLPVVLAGEAYWRQVIDFDFLVRAGTIRRRDLGLFQYAETAPRIWTTIRTWYRRARRPLFPG
jgi:uncharacterized protein (TIGR00730 family)